MVEDSFQRLRTAESKTPTTRLSGMQAWSVPIEKSVLSSVYDFEELQGDECPELQADDELVSDSFFHQRVRDMSMKEWLICIYLFWPKKQYNILWIQVLSKHIH